MTLSGSSKLAGVMGWPVAHSLSPRMHSYWIKAYGIDGAYVPLPVAPENFEQALLALPKLGFRGVNVTVPHKEAALSLVDTADEIATRIGAVNTIAVTADGYLAGSNTDADGFLQNIALNVPDWHAGSGPAVVLGAGGSARAVVAALTGAGCKSVVLVNRTVSKAEALAKHFGRSTNVCSWSTVATALKDASLLVNTTTLGLESQPPLDIDLTMLSPDAVVTDLVYAPLETAFLKDAKARGNRTVDGLGMLLYQAVPGFEQWFGVRPEVSKDLRSFVLGNGT